MKVAWGDTASELPYPTGEELLSSLRQALWERSEQGAYVVHRRTLDLDIARRLLARGRDAAWLERSDADDDEGPRTLYEEFLATSTARRTRYSLERLGMIAKWGPYYCVPSPRRLVLPPTYGEGVSLVLSVETPETVAARVAAAGAKMAAMAGLACMIEGDAASAYPETQSLSYLIKWPAMLPIGDQRGAKAWLLREVETTLAGSASEALEQPIPRTTAYPRLLHPELTARGAGRVEKIENILSRPASLWPGISAGDLAVMAGTWIVNDEKKFTRPVVIALSTSHPDKLHIIPIDPRYGRLVHGILGADRLEPIHFTPRSPGVVEVSGESLRSVAGPALTWLMLSSSSIAHPEEFQQSVEIRSELEDLTRAMLVTYGYEIRSGG